VGGRGPGQKKETNIRAGTCPLAFLGALGGGSDCTTLIGPKPDGMLHTSGDKMGKEKNSGID